MKSAGNGRKGSMTNSPKPFSSRILSENFDLASRDIVKSQNDSQVKPSYLRKAAAAKYLNVSVRTFSDWVRMRMVAHIKPSNRVCLFRITDLDAALNRYRMAAVGEAMF